MTGQLPFGLTMPPKYATAVEWIAVNDEPMELDLEGVQGYISVLLVADVFGKEAEDVAKDVISLRKGAPPSRLYRHLKHDWSDGIEGIWNPRRKHA